MYLVLDIGGTNTRLAISKDGSTLENIRIIKTSQNFDESINSIKSVIAEISGDEQIEAAALGIPGNLNSEKTMIEKSRNLHGWVEQPLKERLLESINAPLFIQNDAALNALGEASFGAGKGFEIVAFFTVSTGFGGCRIVKGLIDINNLGFEPGHQIISFDNDQPIILEDKLSGAAFEKRFGRRAEEIDNPEVWAEAARDLSIGITNALVFWSPNCVVLGGPLIERIDMEDVIKKVSEYNKAFLVTPPIKKAELGEESGLYGALAYLKNKAS